MDVNMVLGVCCVFWVFLLTSASLMPAAFRSGKKVKKRPSSGQKRIKNGLQATEKRKCFRHQFKKMPKKTQLTPKTIFLSIFIFCRTNVRDIYQKYEGHYQLFSTQR